MMADFTPTPSQQAAIETRGTSILVSAGAGSGKTAVLAERCAHLVADVRPPCGVDGLLVVTFTEAAAAEMRQRIARALRERIDADPTNRWLQRQIALLDTASISTIHAFCRHVLNRYFAHADVEPHAPIMDAQDAVLLRQETAKQVFDQFAERTGPTGEAFLDLLAAYGGGSEQGLIRRVLDVDAFLTSIPNPQAWIEAASQRYDTDTADVLPTTWTRLLHETLQTELDAQRQAVVGEIAGLRRHPECVSPAIGCLECYQQALDDWLGQLKGDNDPESLNQVCIHGIGVFEFPKTPRITKKIKELPADERDAFIHAADIVRNVSTELFKKRLKETYGRFSVADWAAGIVRTGKHVKTFLSLATAVRKVYQRHKRDLGVVDFADLERMTLDLLRDDATGVAARLRDQYEHVLVDEFQDVNAVQAAILRLVSREGESDRPGNLFAVGDVKQSIYRFRLAEPKLFLDRQAGFIRHAARTRSTTGAAATDGKGAGNGADGSGCTGNGAGVAIDLVENFRSRPAVIDAVNAIFERLMALDLGGIAYDEHARLKAGLSEDAPAATGGTGVPPVDKSCGTGVSPMGQDQDAASPVPPVELHILESVRATGDDHAADDPHADAFDWEQIEREAYVIAHRVKELADAGTPYRDIVILLRSMQPRAALLLRTMSRLGIPVFADSSGGFFDSLEILDMLSLLELLDNRQQDIPLAAALRSPIFGRPVSDDDLVEIRTTGDGPRGDVPFHAAVRDYAENGPDEPLRNRLAAMLNRLHNWRRRARQRPLADVLWEIYDESGYLAYVTGLRDGRQRRANLMRLHEYARQFGTFQRQGLHRFLRFVNSLRDAGQDLDAGTVVSPGEDVVRVMTIHRSKGLEFPIVILGELGKRFNLADARGPILFDRRLGLAFEAVDLDRRIAYPTLPHRLVSQAAEAEARAEEMRVLYVALTRAKQRLILVGAGAGDDLQQDRQRFAGHTGPLPVLHRRTAHSMLDWVSAAIGCQPTDCVAFGGKADETPAQPTPPHGGRQRSADGPLFDVRVYDREQMADWIIDPPQRHGVAERLERCSRMQPLPDVDAAADAAVNADADTDADVNADVDTDAQRADRLAVNQDCGTGVSPVNETCGTSVSPVNRVARRLTTPYPARSLTKIPAVAAASTIKKRWDAGQDDTDPVASEPGRPRPGIQPASRPRFHEPTFLGRSGAPDPTSRGTWTHALLEHLDRRRPCDAADLRDQLAAMTTSGIFLPNEAAAICLDDVAWFFQTSIGVALRSTQTRVLREWPFVIGVAPTRYDSAATALDDADIMLVRGIIDCVFDRGNGWEILDYKTDDISADDITARAAEYRGQLDIYAAAVQAVHREEVRHRWLAFLGPRQITET